MPVSQMRAAVVVVPNWMRRLEAGGQLNCEKGSVEQGAAALAGNYQSADNGRLRAKETT